MKEFIRKKNQKNGVRLDKKTLLFFCLKEDEI
jgi:hypothetical protein